MRLFSLDNLKKLEEYSRTILLENRVPDAEILIGLAAVLGTTVDKLLKG